MIRKALLTGASLALLLAAWDPQVRGVEKPPPCPVSLTNPDGQALILDKYDLRLAVHGPLALTEMEMVFRNPENRQMEGRFLYVLPTGATVSRFAKEVDGKLMEGEVVERMRAQRIYTEILHTMRDPALLEMDQGNRFSARVFPIAANGSVRLVLSFSQVLAVGNLERKLTIPMAGMPKIGDFNFSAVIRGWPGESLKEESTKGFAVAAEQAGSLVTLGRNAKEFTPEQDIALAFRPGAAAAGPGGVAGPWAIRAGNFQMIAYGPRMFVKEQRELMTGDWVFYFDTSASNADTEARRLEAIDLLLKAAPLRGNRTLSAWAFDVGIADLGGFNEKPDPGYGPGTVLRELRKRHCLGATNLEAALKHIGEQARAAKQSKRFVLVSDGIATLGKREVGDVVAALGDWPRQHTMHALVLGLKQDDKMLNAIVEKTRGRVIAAPLGEGMEAGVKAAVEDMQWGLGAGYRFSDEGARWIYPKSFRDVRAGSELVAFMEMKEGAESRPVLIELDSTGKPVKETPLDVKPAEVPDFAPLLQREANAALLSHLEKLESAEKDETAKKEMRNKRIEISVKSRVMCPLTSLLVLETEADYKRFGIDRSALSDILVVGKNGIELKHRKAEDLVLKQPPKRAPRETKKAEAAAKPGDADEKSKDAAADKAPEAKMDADGEDMKELADGAPQAGAVRARGAGRAEGAAPAAPPPEAPAGRETEATRRADPRPAADRPSEPARPAPMNQTPAQPQAQPAKFQSPDWVKQYGAAPKDDELTALYNKVAAQPKDRNLRNAYSDALLKAEKWDNLQAQVFEWMPFDPENPQVFEFLGKSAANLGEADTALRAFTSIAEIAPNRAALLARAGWLLLVAKKHDMAAEMFSEALKNRQDDPNLYRGLSLALYLKGDFAGAAKALEDGLKQNFHGRYGDVSRVLKEELAYVFRAWMKSVQTQADNTHPQVVERAAKLGLDLKRADALRVTLGWETDANDVDLHVTDPNGEECFYSHKNNVSGLELYSDQTQGLGPEVVRCEKALPGVYHVAVNYFSAGPMGVSRGVAVVFQPKDGIVEQLTIVPFCLVPGGPDMRHLAAAKFEVGK